MITTHDDFPHAVPPIAYLRYKENWFFIILDVNNSVYGMAHFNYEPGQGRARVSCNLMVGGETFKYGTQIDFPKNFALARQIGGGMPAAIEFELRDIYGTSFDVTADIANRMGFVPLTVEAANAGGFDYHIVENFAPVILRQSGERGRALVEIGLQGAPVKIDDYQTLRLSLNGSILTITLNRPELRNATNNLMERELCSAFLEASHDTDTRVIVLTGAGQAFSAGGDFEYIRDNLQHPPNGWNAAQWGKQIVFTLLDCAKPVIAKINGHAVGFGATLALFCDVTFAANHAKIGDPHVAVGLVAGDGGAVIWPQLIGFSRAKEFLFSGEPMLAPEAARIGLINHALPAEELDRAVDAYAAKLASMPPRALQWTKASVNIALKQLAHSIMDASIAYELVSVTTEDHRAAMDALRDKSKPEFTGN